MQPNPLLATKLYMPPIRHELVPRPDLTQRLTAGLRRKLTLVSAPAGFGKTTLVSEWVNSLRSGTPEENQTSNRISWLSLDAGDNDPTRFLTYVVAALSQSGESDATSGNGALSMLQSSHPPPTEVILTSLINDMAALDDRLVLVLDDYHVIEAEPIDSALAFLLEHLPVQMHLVIATREDPHLPLARLRARGQLTELRAADLRFTSSEAAEFLNKAMGLDLSAADIAALEARTEGWIAGLQLAALALQGLALQGTHATPRHRDASSRIESFTGSHRFVLDYLIEETLEQQSEKLQTFLLQTAVLDRLTGSLCDALTGQDDGQATLEYLEHANLFIVPLDNERHWYRYHHLFADLLRQRARQNQAEQQSELHHRASVWYEQNGLAGDAIKHALRGEDFERAMRLIEEHVDAAWQRGEHAGIRRWLEAIPTGLMRYRPQLCIFRTYYLLVSGQHDAGELLLQDVEKALDAVVSDKGGSPPVEQSRLSEPERAKLRGRVAVIRATLSAQRVDVPGIIHHASKALDYLPEHDLTWRNLAAIALGDAYSHMGDMTASYKIRSETVRGLRASSDSYYLVVASMKLTATLRAQGRLQRALEICREQKHLANSIGLAHTHVMGWLLATWGEVLAELGDLDGALRQTREGVALTKSRLNLGTFAYSRLCLMRVLFSRGDLDDAEEIVRKTESAALEYDVPLWLTQRMSVWQARIWLARGKLDAASQWAEARESNIGREPLPKLDFYSLSEVIMLARVWMAQGRLDEAFRLLQQLLEQAEAGGRTTSLIGILLLQALTRQAAGDTVQAMTALERALALAEPEGFIRIFVDEGPPMALLLYEALSRNIAPDYVRQLLAAFPTADSEEITPSKAQAPESGLIEPLSERELEILRLIAEGLTNPQVAARLYLATNTIKAHTRNIYGKLGVNNRTQAASRARALGILPPG